MNSQKHTFFYYYNISLFKTLSLEKFNVKMHLIYYKIMCHFYFKIHFTPLSLFLSAMLSHFTNFSFPFSFCCCWCFLCFSLHASCWYVIVIQFRSAIDCPWQKWVQIDQTSIPEPMILMIVWCTHSFTYKSSLPLLPLMNTLIECSKHNHA